MLHHAAQTNSVAVARLLVKCGADVSAKTRVVRAAGLPRPQLPSLGRQDARQ
jgi:hypothetical protein